MPIGKTGLEWLTPDDLQGMPIHVVDANWNTCGLRAMLAAVTISLDEPDRQAIVRAELVASRLHAQDTRSGGRPYVNHLLRTAIRIVRYYHVRDAEVICAALLHDSVEDHPRDFSYLFTNAERAMSVPEAALAVLGRAFGRRVATLVGSLTNPESDPNLPLEERQELWRRHVIESLEADPVARVIKFSDFVDNGAGIYWTVTGTMRMKLARKYAPIVPHLVDFAQRPDTPLDFDAKTEVVKKLKAAEVYFERILRSGNG